MVNTLLLNRYELLEKIGEGGMGIVYKAKCHLLDRFVAVKILKAELSTDEKFIARFKREANSVASLSHPNIVNIHDVGAEGNVNFIVMEYVDGGTLKQLIKEKGRLSVEETLDIALQIAKGLECAHKNNIIHRDIKPDNIMITEDNIVKIMDFGIAKVVDEDTITNSNKVTGSVHYFSPEQAKGSFVDFRTDIYSFGIVMYEMVTGQVPYNADNSVSIAIMHIQQPVIPPKEVIGDIPESLNQAILKALEKNPINRYQTAKEMDDILSAIKEDFNFKFNLNKRSMDATTFMMEPVAFNTKTNLTTVISPVEDKKELLSNKGTSKNKRIMIVIASISLVMIIVFLGKYLSKSLSADTKAPIAKTTTAKVSAPVDEKKPVPSLTGINQDSAEKAIVNDGFLLGIVSNDYSDSVAKGLIISQNPVVNTPYDKNGKIDLVVSQGPKIDSSIVPKVVQDVVPQLKGLLKEKKNGRHK